MKIYANSIKGSKHDSNEDNYFISKDLKGKHENYKLMLLLDGISAYQNASKLTSLFVDHLKSMKEKELFTVTDYMFKLKGIHLIEALNSASKQIKSGTTLSILILEQNSKTIQTYNLGDSPIYLIRRNILMPIYGDSSKPAYDLREYDNLSRIKICNELFHQIRPDKEILILKKSSSITLNSNMVMSAIPYFNDTKKHFFKFHYNENDSIIMGSDGFISHYNYPNFEKIYVSMANQIRNGGEETLNSFIKLNSQLTTDDATGIFISL
jgi:serine/threonine protein phosphatase PrpC